KQGVDQPAKDIGIEKQWVDFSDFLKKAGHKLQRDKTLSEIYALGLYGLSWFWQASMIFHHKHACDKSSVRVDNSSRNGHKSRRDGRFKHQTCQWLMDSYDASKALDLA